MNKKIYLASPHMSDEGYEQKYVKEAFDTNWIAPLGENVNKFEEELASYVGTKYAAALSAGTASLHLAMKLAGIEAYGMPKVGHGALEGKKVFCSDMTFDATVNPVVYEGGEPVFIDTEYDTWNMDPVALEKAFEIYPDTKVVVVAHLYGTPGKEHGVPVIEDAAESLGSLYHGQATGTFVDYGIFSFNGNKIITGSAGGCFLTDDEEAANKVRKWSTQARENAAWYQHEELGYNYRMSNVCAGIGCGQMTVLDQHIAHHKHVQALYEDLMKDIPGVKINKQPNDPRYDSNYWLCTMTLEPSVKVKGQENAYKEVIKTAVGGAAAVVYTNGIEEDLFKIGMCLPAGPYVTDDDVRYIVDCIKEAIEL